MGAAVFTLLPESLHGLSFFEVVLGTLSGYLLFFFITKYYSHVCPACSATHFDERTTKKFSEIVRALLIALSVHSFLDGVALATHSNNSELQGASIFFAILAHKLPEGLALAALMISAGYLKQKVLLYVFLVEMVTVVGAVSGNFLLKNIISQTLSGAVMSHIAGGFIFLAVHALLGEMIKNHKKLVITSFSVGLLLILIIDKFSH